jgi:hypothetical protein
VHDDTHDRHSCTSIRNASKEKMLAFAAYRHHHGSCVRSNVNQIEIQSNPIELKTLNGI